MRSTRDAGEDGLTAIVERHRVWMLRHGTTTFEGKSGYGLDRDTELASLRAIRDAGGIATWLGAHAVPPEFAGNGDAYLEFALVDGLHFHRRKLRIGQIYTVARVRGFVGGV